MPRNKIYDEHQFPSPFEQTWRDFRSNPIAWTAFCVAMFFVIVALFAPFLVPYSPYQQNPNDMLLPPSWSDNGDVQYLLGTDDLGRDFLSRLIYGTRLTFGSAMVVAFCAMVTGVALGSLAGLSKGIKSSFFNHLLDAILSIPSLLLAIIIVAILGPGLNNTIWAVFLALVPQFVHRSRLAIEKEQKKEYVTAARLDGANDWQILIYSIFPNIVDSLVLQYTLALSTAMLDIAALGFLGLGADPSSPEWGSLLSEGIDLLYRASWLVTLPGINMFLCLLSVNIIGNSLRRSLQHRVE